MRTFVLGAAAGAVGGYLAIRAGEAIADLRTPASPLAPDAATYGRLRRALMLAGIGRSLATLAVGAFVVTPACAPPAGERETRARRLALVAAGLATATLLEFPADYVEGFVLERRYGLSKQTARAWLVDRAKGFGISTAVALPLVELLASAIARAPRTWPALATAGTIPLVILANVIVPVYVAPLFNAFVPIEGDLANAIRALASRFGAGDATLLRVDMSRQTEKANAYVTGLFGTKRIVIGDTLLDHFEERETLFVVAHELGHYVKGDVWRGVALATLASALVFFAGRALAERPGESLATVAGLARLSFAMTVLGTAAGPVLAAFSRQREWAADRFALDATHDPHGGAAAFRRLRDRNLAEAEQPRWMELLFSSHPSLGRRIDALERAGVTSRSGS
jgi:STE24 endopeptidase